jgi:hypothetical protein
VNCEYSKAETSIVTAGAGTVKELATETSMCFIA